MSTDRKTTKIQDTLTILGLGPRGHNPSLWAGRKYYSLLHYSQNSFSNISFNMASSWRLSCFDIWTAIAGRRTNKNHPQTTYKPSQALQKELYHSHCKRSTGQVAIIAKVWVLCCHPQRCQKSCPTRNQTGTEDSKFHNGLQSNVTSSKSPKWWRLCTLSQCCHMLFTS